MSLLETIETSLMYLYKNISSKSYINYYTDLIICVNTSSACGQIFFTDVFHSVSVCLKQLSNKLQAVASIQHLPDDSAFEYLTSGCVLCVFYITHTHGWQCEVYGTFELLTGGIVVGVHNFWVLPEPVSVDFAQTVTEYNVATSRMMYDATDVSEWWGAG